MPISIVIVAACAPPAPPPTGPVTFERAIAWVHTAGDSLRLSVEVARTAAQQERGLSGRPTLADDAGMLFLFTELRSPDDGFWMWGTRFPLDVAFVDPDGVIVDLLTMPACDGADEDACPGHFPSSAYGSALEVNAGWFGRAGVEVGDRVTVTAVR